MKVTELRQYKIKTGKTEQWLTWMKDELLPYQRSKGMRVLNTYVHTGEDGHDYLSGYVSSTVNKRDKRYTQRLTMSAGLARFDQKCLS